MKFGIQELVKKVTKKRRCELRNPNRWDLEILRSKAFLEDYAKAILEDVKKQLDSNHKRKETFASAMIFVYIRELVDEFSSQFKG